jgi:signal peptide peptidase SppA
MDGARRDEASSIDGEGEVDWITRLRRLLPERWRVPAPVVPVLRLTGVIGTVSPLRSGLSIVKAAGAIERAFSVKRAKAVAIVINSPGGAPAQAHLIMRRIRAFSAEKKIPVIAFVEDVAASGGYMIACAADEIFADPSSIIGSIGVVSASFGFDRFIERFGIERRVHTAGRSKAMLDPFKPEDPEDVERLEILQREIHDMFIALVKERRGATLSADDDEIFSGAFWTAQRAIDLGLADGLGDLRTTLRARFGDKVRMKPITLERSFLGRRLAGVEGSAAEGAVGAMVAALVERSYWSRFGL